MDSEQVVSDNTQTEVSDSTENQEKIKTRGEQKYANDLVKWKQTALEADKRLKELEEKLQQRDLEEEEKKGNLSKVVEEYRNRTKTLEDQLKKKDYLFAKANIESAVKTEAVKKGCKDPDAFFKLLGTESLDAVEFDDSYRPNLDDIKAVVDDGAKKWQHIGLFGTKVVVADGSPKTTNTDMDVKKMSTEQLKELIKSLK